MCENSTLCMKGFAEQANAAGSFIVHQAYTTGAYIVHHVTLRVVHKVERGSPTVKIMINLFICQIIIFELIVAWLRHMAAWVGINFSSANGLLSDNIKTFPEPMLTYHCPGPMAFILGYYRLPAEKM